VQAPICLIKSVNEGAREAGRLLSNLHARRLKADYRLDESSPDERRFGEMSIMSATEIQKCLDDFRNECQRNPGLRMQLHDEVMKLFKIWRIPTR
jgi:hypothetical protein